MLCLVLLDYHLALKPLGEFHRVDIHPSPEDIRKPDDKGGAHAESQRKPNVVVVSLDTSDGVGKLLQVKGKGVHAGAVHEVERVRDLSEILDDGGVEDSLPSRETTHGEDQHRGAPCLPVSVLVRTPIRHVLRQPHPARSLQRPSRLSDEVESSNTNKGPDIEREFRD